MSETSPETFTPFSRIELARKAAGDIPDGWYVNLGVGIPLLVSEHVPEGRHVTFQAENGLLGFGPKATPGKEDWWVSNAGGVKVTINPGGAIVDHSDSFAMIRGGHLDLCILGAYQVARNGDLANWITNDPDVMPAVGGAMDLAAGAQRLWIITDHNTKTGEPKLLDRCTYPLTALRKVKRVYSNLAVIDIDEEGMKVREMAPGLTFDELQARTGTELRMA